VSTRRLVLTWAVALVATACARYTGGAHPIDPNSVQRDPSWVTAAPTPTVHQRGLADCGLAALAMVAGRWHVELSLDEARKSVPAPTANGVKLGDLRAAARAHGLIAFAVNADESVLEHEIRAGRPVIVGLLRPYGRDRALSHFEVVVALRAAPESNDQQVVTIDPAGGWQVRSWTDLDREWKPAGRPALVVLGTDSDTSQAAR
jgi:ABC-type bacteriocin/lantibiotic exporter with double-glycine peptidase domain